MRTQYPICRSLSITLLLLFILGGGQLSTAYAQGGFSCSSVTGLPQVECEALVTLYNSTDGVNWTDNSSWLTTNTPCSWFGVTCNTGHVTGLLLRSNQLSGSIPSELGNLVNLQSLSLGFNQLSGNIPPDLGNLTNLQHLALNTNQLNGSIPSELGNLANLQFLSVAANQLSGSIPPELGNLTNLRELRLNINQLSGSSPPWSDPLFRATWNASLSG